MLKVSETFFIYESDYSLDFVQSSGPGGQNVNKVATAVQLRYDTHTPHLPDEVRTRLFHIARKRITEDGILIIEAKRYRSQERNRADAIQRLVALIRMAAERPKPRRKTRPSRASIEHRLKAKRQRAIVKQGRGVARHVPE